MINTTCKYKVTFDLSTVPLCAGGPRCFEVNARRLGVRSRALAVRLLVALLVMYHPPRALRGTRPTPVATYAREDQEDRAVSRKILLCKERINHWLDGRGHVAVAELRRHDAAVLRDDELVEVPAKPGVASELRAKPNVDLEETARDVGK